MPDTAASMRRTLFGNLESGNVHKVQLILAYRGIPFRRVDVHQTKGQPRDPRFLAINPMGKVPAVLLADGDMISDSGALLFHFAQGTPLWPAATRGQTEVLRWMFFEQYSHEPALAVLRYHLRYTPDPDQHDRRIAELMPKARFALDVLEQHLAASDWIAGSEATIADYALYPYSRLAGECGLAIADWPAVSRWLDRFERQPRFVPLYRDAAVETLSFAGYFGA